MKPVSQTRPIRSALKGRAHVCIALALAFMFVLTALPAQAKYASFVINASNGEILHEVNADTRNYPASLTKMMTLYLMFEAIEQGRMHMSDRVVFSRRAARQPSSKLGIAAGKSISVKEAILSLAVKSANDVASAVSEHMGGTERKFALIMTAKARKLGMNRTIFRNASGLPHRAQLSTARDMATLAHALMRDFPHRYGYFSQTNFKLQGKVHKTHNTLLTTYEGTDGIKTGYIRASGFQLVTSVKRGNQRLIGVVFGGKTAKLRNRHMTTLLNKSFAKLDRVAASYVPEDIPTIVPTVMAKAKTDGAKPTPAPVRKPDIVVASRANKILSRRGQTVWGVQVGAYRQRQPAIDIAAKAVGLAPSYLAEGEIMVSPLYKKSGRVLYRARVVGVAKNSAYRACKFLERQKMDCLEVRVTLPMEVAAR